MMLSFPRIRGSELSDKRLALRVLIEKRARSNHLEEGRGSFGRTEKMMCQSEEKCQVTRGQKLNHSVPLYPWTELEVRWQSDSIS